jgi:hypothetical protein
VSQQALHDKDLSLLKGPLGALSIGLNFAALHQQLYSGVSISVKNSLAGRQTVNDQ